MAEKFLGRRLTQEEMAQAVTTNLTDYDTAKKYFEEMKKGNKDTYTKGSADKKTKDVRYPNAEESQKYQQLIGVKQGDPKEREALEKYYGKKIPITQVYNYRMFLFENNIFKDGKSKDKYTGDPLTKKGNKILKAMRERYGKKKGTSVFYASKNKGTISGVDGKTKDVQHNVSVKQMPNTAGLWGVYIDNKLYIGKIANKENADDFANQTRSEIQKEGGLTDFIERQLKTGTGDSKTKDESTPMVCNECGKHFQKNITSSTVEVKCPACGGYDTEPE